MKEILVILITMLSINSVYSQDKFYKKIVVAKYNGRIVSVADYKIELCDGISRGEERFTFSIKSIDLSIEDLTILEEFYGWERSSWGTNNWTLKKDVEVLSREKYRLTEGNILTLSEEWVVFYLCPDCKELIIRK